MLKRVLEFKQWNDRKIAVLHMQKSTHNLSESLKGLQIPHIEYEQADPSFVTKMIQDSPSIIGLIIGGGVLENGDSLPVLDTRITGMNVPKMGICLGHEILGVYLGANLIRCNSNIGEFSEVELEIYPDLIYNGLDTPSTQTTKMEHYYMIDKVPPGSKLIASSDLTPIAGFHDHEKSIWGFQFHPEKDWMKYIILKNFYKYCTK